MDMPFGTMMSPEETPQLQPDTPIPEKSDSQSELSPNLQDIFAAMKDEEPMGFLSNPGVITQQNWLQHLDSLSDEQITDYLNRTQNKEVLDEERQADPSISDRTRAEYLRDF